MSFYPREVKKGICMRRKVVMDGIMQIKRRRKNKRNKRILRNKNLMIESFSYYHCKVYIVFHFIA